MQNRPERFQTTDTSEVTRQRSEKSNNWKNQDTIKHDTKYRRMQWLYSTITRYGTSHEFSESAREWVKQRIATEDVSSRVEDPLVTNQWWQETYKDYLDDHTANMLVSEDSFTHSLVFPDTSANINTNVQRYTLDDILQSSILLNEFIEYASTDQEGYTVHFEFLMRYLPLKQQAEQILQVQGDIEVASDIIKETREILTDFFIHGSPLSSLVTPNNIAHVNSLLPHKSSRSIRPITYNILKSLYDPLVIEVFSSFWSEYITNEDYLGLCQTLSDAQNKPAIPQSPTNASLLLQISGSETMSQAGIPQLSQWFPFPVAAWHNTGHFTSITFTLHIARGPLIQKYNQIYACFGSGSRIIKSRNTNGQFRITATLPLLSTTPYVWVMLGSQGKCIGVVVFPIADLIKDTVPPSSDDNNNNNTTISSSSNALSPSISSSSLNTSSHGVPQPFWIPLRTETSILHLGENTLTNTLAAAMQSNPQDTSNPISFTGNDEIMLSYSLGQDEINPNERIEGFKSIYADSTAQGGNFLSDFIRGKVSKKKKRFCDDNFNLDLTYITPQIIAMGFPSEGAEGVYRNPLRQVQSFFLLRHPGAYRIYNLCSERAYDVGKFENRCECFPFDDHNPPPFSLMVPFCEDARSFLAASPQNVVSIHCKAGKGRTGTMIASLLIYMTGQPARICLDIFGKARTSNGAGVTIMSQMRYVHYFDHYCALRRAGRQGPGRTTLFLESLALRNVGSKYSLIDPQFTIHHPNKKWDLITNQIIETSVATTFSSYKQLPCTRINNATNNNSVSWDMAHKLIELHEDVRIEITAKPNALASREKVLHCWINTRFLVLSTEYDPSSRPMLRLNKALIDKVAKDTSHKKFDKDMCLELTFTRTSTSLASASDLFVENRLDLLKDMPDWLPVPQIKGSQPPPSSSTPYLNLTGRLTTTSRPSNEQSRLGTSSGTSTTFGSPLSPLPPGGSVAGNNSTTGGFSRSTAHSSSSNNPLRTSASLARPDNEPYSQAAGFPESTSETSLEHSFSHVNPNLRK